MLSENVSENSRPEAVWNIDEDILFDMNQYERDRVFDQRMHRLYEALVALSAGSKPDEVMRILHSEE